MRATVVMATLALVPLCGCLRPAISTSSVLPLTSVRLYETGVGYFERSGVVNPDEHTRLPVPASHLDDALQSLVVFTPGHADSIRGVAFGSSVSRGMARAMARLPADSDAPITYRDLLLSLKGAHVEVKTRVGAYVGRLIDIESPKDAEPAEGVQPRQAAPSIVVLTDGAELVRVPMNDVTTVRPTDPAYGARLDAALDALSLHSAENRKMLDVLGVSRGPVTLGYVAETPVWRTTYRLVLDADGRRGALQGWALVHNDTDEDWESVKVELVNGRPDSFLYPLAAPRYARRALVHPDDQLSTVPQLLDKTPDAVWGDNVDDAVGAGGLGLSGLGEGGGGYREGIGLGSIGSIGHGRGMVAGSSPSSAVTVGDLASVPQGGVLVEHFRRTTDTTYAFENRSGHACAVYLTLHLGTNAKVTGADAVDFDSATSTPLAVTRIGPKARFEREIVTVEGLASTVALESLSAERLSKVAASPRLAAADRAVATDALARQGELEETRRARARATEDLAAIEKELERLREDAKAVSGERGAATAPEFVRRLLAAEDRHASARKRLDELETEDKVRVEMLRSTLAKLGS